MGMFPLFKSDKTVQFEEILLSQTPQTDSHCDKVNNFSFNKKNQKRYVSVKNLISVKLVYLCRHSLKMIGKHIFYSYLLQFSLKPHVRKFMNIRDKI